METANIVLDRVKARELWNNYRKHQHWSEPIDRDVMATYHAIARGKLVIKALESIRTAGLNEQGLPKLAIVRADSRWCWFDGQDNGAGTFASSDMVLRSWRDNAYPRQRVNFPAGSFPGMKRKRAKAITPQVPLPLRPKRALASYHVLFEAEWTLAPPVDPILLRRVGKADLWVVCAAWELTEVERAALAARLTS